MVPVRNVLTFVGYEKVLENFLQVFWKSPGFLSVKEWEPWLYFCSKLFCL